MVNVAVACRVRHHRPSAEHFILDINDGCNTLTGVDAGDVWSGGVR
jgi:hypothetical protein